MPMPNDDRLEKITLLVGGHAYSDWKEQQQYRYDASQHDLLHFYPYFVYP